jgi:hypothetical protein
MTVFATREDYVIIKETKRRRVAVKRWSVSEDVAQQLRRPCDQQPVGHPASCTNSSSPTKAACYLSPRRNGSLSIEQCAPDEVHDYVLPKAFGRHALRNFIEARRR